MRERGLLICGIKLTHDGAVAVIEDGRLLCSVEMEKLRNQSRYQRIPDTDEIAAVLGDFGLVPGDIDHYVVDGWGGYAAARMDPQPGLTVHPDHNELAVPAGGRPITVGVRQYIERRRIDDILAEAMFTGLQIGGRAVPHSSFLHVTGHVMGAYGASPFARREESAYVLVWDGGMYPQLYYVDAMARRVTNLGPLFLLMGNIYTVFSQHFGPFKVDAAVAFDNLSIAGKVMAYAALGVVRPALFDLLDQLTARPALDVVGLGNVLAAAVRIEAARTGVSDEDVLTTFQAYLQCRLIDGLAKRVAASPDRTPNLCMAGGCALNVVWNGAIRQAGIFREVFVPPFPNDAGSALGQACAKQVMLGGPLALDWSVYAGPGLALGERPEGWHTTSCTPVDLARLLHDVGEPVVVLHGRAEIGPRALGNRSILARADDAAMKDRLNAIKQREPYRPVAPICVEEAAPRFFDPGTPDPFMVFNHDLRPEWRERLAAIMHVDGSARLQTVSAADNPVIHAVLSAFGDLSGVPVLCNTSANHAGRGFFPDAASAMAWGGVRYVWSEGTLYERDRVEAAVD